MNLTLGSSPPTVRAPREVSVCTSYSIGETERGYEKRQAEPEEPEKFQHDTAHKNHERPQIAHLGTFAHGWHHISCAVLFLRISARTSAIITVLAKRQILAINIAIPFRVPPGKRKKASYA